MSLASNLHDIHKYRNLILVVFLFGMVATLSFLATSNMDHSSARASTDGFNPGNIMSDAVMSNYSSMTKDEIQTFLSAKGNCNNTNYNLYLQIKAQYPKTDWHFKDGKFVCLSEEVFGLGNTFGDSVPAGEGQTAAEIIYEAAQDYHINPQVLIVLLEKEQSLITDSYPNSVQYRSATGYGCPDTAACDTKYYGFRNQVRNAAAMFRSVLDGGWSNYPAGRTMYVQYHPSASCGGSQIYIENRATSALYRYTPYQPNSSALAAGYGNGDSCSAYGNRNFYLYFTDWFGSTTFDIPTAKYPVIADGVYTLVSGSTYDTALAANGTTSGSNVSMDKRANSDAQKWQISYHSDDHTYSFTNRAAGLALNIHDADSKSGANIEIANSSNGCHQKWRAVVNNDGTFSFVSACLSTVAIDVYGASSKPGANVQSFGYHGGVAQKWHIVPDAALPDGLYSISPSHNESLTLDVFGGYSANGTNVQAYTNHESAGEKWRLQYDSKDGTYKILNLGSNTSLDAYAAGTENGTNVQIYDYHGGCSQKWIIVPSGKGYTVTSACSGLALDVYGARAESGTNVQLWQQNGNQNQNWKITSAIEGALTPGTYRIVSAGNKNLALDAGNADKSGDNVRIFDQQNSQAQAWKLTYNSDGTYFIANAKSELSLDVYGGFTWDETNIQLFTMHSGQNQKWIIEENPNGTYSIYSANSRKTLDVYGGNTTSGGNVQQFTWHGGTNQQWRFVKI